MEYNFTRNERKKENKRPGRKINGGEAKINYQQSDSGLNKDGNKVKKIRYKGSIYTYGNVIRDK